MAQLISTRHLQLPADAGGLAHLICCAQAAVYSFRHPVAITVQDGAQQVFAVSCLLPIERRLVQVRAEPDEADVIAAAIKGE